MKYRIPTSILWNNGGWREVCADNFNDAVKAFKAKWPSMRIEYPTIQMYIGYDWAFTETTPEYLGGYDRGRYG